MAAINTSAVTQITSDTFTVPSQSRPGESWIVKHVNGNTTCDCPQGFYRGRCKHGRAVENYLIEQRRPKVSDELVRQALNIFMAPKHRT